MTNLRSTFQSRKASKPGASALEKWTERIFGEGRVEAGMETMEILTDLAQVSELFSSLEDLRRGHVVGMSDAFGDL